MCTVLRNRGVKHKARSLRPSNFGQARLGRQRIRTPDNEFRCWFSVLTKLVLLGLMGVVVQDELCHGVLDISRVPKADREFF